MGDISPGVALSALCVLTALCLEDWPCVSPSLWRRGPEDCAPKWNLPHCCTMSAPSEENALDCVGVLRSKRTAKCTIENALYCITG